MEKNVVKAFYKLVVLFAVIPAALVTGALAGLIRGGVVNLPGTSTYYWTLFGVVTVYFGARALVNRSRYAAWKKTNPEDVVEHYYRLKPRWGFLRYFLLSMCIWKVTTPTEADWFPSIIISLMTAFLGYLAEKILLLPAELEPLVSDIQYKRRQKEQPEAPYVPHNPNHATYDEIRRGEMECIRREFGKDC